MERGVLGALICDFHFLGVGKRAPGEQIPFYSIVIGQFFSLCNIILDMGMTGRTINGYTSFRIWL
jgi:hypothetical protein